MTKSYDHVCLKVEVFVDDSGAETQNTKHKLILSSNFILFSILANCCISISNQDS